MSSSWSDRFYQSLSQRRPPSLPLPRLLLSAELRRQRQLLQNAVAVPEFGFENLPTAQLQPRQSVLIAWPCPRGRLTPASARIALTANFVLLINRAFGHRVGEAVASVSADHLPTTAAAHQGDAGASQSLLVADLARLRLRLCRLESEDCFVRESHRLAKTLSSLRLAGSEAWCGRRLADLLAALARAESSGCQRLHWVASRQEVNRFADLAASLCRLGYRQLAYPSPWPIHVSVGPVVMATGDTNYSLEDWLVREDSRDNLLLQMLAQPRNACVELNCKTPALSSKTLTQYRLRLARHHLSSLMESCAMSANTPWDFYLGSHWTPGEAALAKHLVEYPDAVSSAYMSYEPCQLVGYLDRLVELVIELAKSCPASKLRSSPSRLLVVAAAKRVLDSACAILGLGG